MELKPDHLYYNIYDNFYYIGNGAIFIQGVYINKRIEITCMKSYYKYNIDMIGSFSYMKVAEYKFDSKDDAFTFNEMIKMWNKYNNYYLDIYHIKLTSFKLVGNILNQIQYRNLSLFDIILYKNMISYDELIQINKYINNEKINLFLKNRN